MRGSVTAFQSPQLFVSFPTMHRFYGHATRLNAQTEYIIALLLRLRLAPFGRSNPCTKKISLPSPESLKFVILSCCFSAFS